MPGLMQRMAATTPLPDITLTLTCRTGYLDLASLGTLPKYTCGHLYFHPNFSVPRDAHRLANELGHNLTRLTGWEAVMRIRCSRGLRISNFHGNFFIRSTDLLALPQVLRSLRAHCVNSSTGAVLAGCSVGLVAICRDNPTCLKS